MKQPHDGMKTTVPESLVGASEEQPSSKKSTKSISDNTKKSKTDYEVMLEYLRALREMSRTTVAPTPVPKAESADSALDGRADRARSAIPLGEPTILCSRMDESIIMGYYTFRRM